MTTLQYVPLYESFLKRYHLWILFLYLKYSSGRKVPKRVFYNKKHMYMKNLYKPTISDWKQWYLRLWSWALLWENERGLKRNQTKQFSQTPSGVFFFGVRVKILLWNSALQKGRDTFLLLFLAGTSFCSLCRAPDRSCRFTTLLQKRYLTIHWLKRN